MNKNRLYEVDVVRSLAIIVALLIHVRVVTSSDFWLIQMSMFVSANFFKIGVVFIFITGMMSVLVYLPKWNENRRNATIRVLKKSMFLLSVYCIYVVFFALLFNIEIGNFPRFLWSNSFLIRIMLIIGMIYILQPVLLWLLSKIKPWMSIFLGFLMIFFSLVIFRHQGDESMMSLILWNLHKNWYAIIPLIGVYFFGSFYGFKYKKWNPSASLSLGIFLLLVIGVFINHQYSDSFLFHSSAWLRLCIQVGLIGLLLASLKGVSARIMGLRDESRKIIDILLLPGSESMVFFITGNVIINLFRWNRIYSRTSDWILILATLGAAYLMSYLAKQWRVSNYSLNKR